jgi:hypothetical protein
MKTGMMPKGHKHTHEIASWGFQFSSCLPVTFRHHVRLHGIMQSPGMQQYINQ